MQPLGCVRALSSSRRVARAANTAGGRSSGDADVGAPAVAIAAALIVGGALLVGEAVWIHAKAWLAQVLLERAFAATLKTGKDVKPWPWADTWPVARVSFPRLHRSAIVLAGASGQALAFGPGQVARTPAAGEPGTAIYSGHRDTHFAFLGDVARGDEIGVTRRDGRKFRFRVTGTSVVRWDFSGIDPAAAGHHLALVTCWPLDGKFSGPLRYVVHAELVGDTNLPGRPRESGEP
jgi:sortase A